MFDWTDTGMLRRAAEVSGASNGGRIRLSQGLLTGTKIASNLGWRSVEALTPGDGVLTFDHGMQEVTGITRMSTDPDTPQSDPARWPIVVPTGALGNRSELTLLPDQGVLVESDAAAEFYGDPFTILPALALDGLRGIHRAAPLQTQEWVALGFDGEQVIYVEGGGLIHCPAAMMALESFFDPQTSGYQTLNHADAVFLAECMALEDHGRISLSSAPRATLRC